MYKVHDNTYKTVNISLHGLHTILKSAMSERLEAYDIHLPSDERLSIVVATFANSSGVQMSSWMIRKSLHLIIKLPPCNPLSFFSTASTLWWRSWNRYTKKWLSYMKENTVLSFQYSLLQDSFIFKIYIMYWELSHIQNEGNLYYSWNYHQWTKNWTSIYKCAAEDITLCPPYWKWSNEDVWHFSDW